MPVNPNPLMSVNFWIYEEEHTLSTIKNYLIGKKCRHEIT